MEKRLVLMLTMIAMMAFSSPVVGETNESAHLATQFAKSMDVEDMDNLTWTSVAGVPTEVNGQKVPEKLYTEEQLRAIRQARNIDRLMGEAMMQETHVLQYQRNVPIESTEVDTSAY